MADEGIQKQPDPSPDMETTEARITEQERLATLADNVKQWVPATYLYGSLSLVHGKMLPAEAFIAYLEKFLEEAGGPTDPIERLLLEQLAFAHHNTGLLYIDAAAATAIEEARVLNGTVSTPDHRQHDRSTTQVRQASTIQQWPERERQQAKD